ncbi:MAG: bifunctional phosphoribosyl-AMP cyclohydrolase/phosphoribosyl-ATP diphosphatase HisIE [Lachnospiraceae bacterium]|nr:bifunctional phosphoribosyl-AMP cyclohydrolase/phosphoribosyl-ATP diphosphatase HisIE [Lachnospiraceae bacterium]
MVSAYVKRFEDVKKAFYTGASEVVICFEDRPADEVLKEAVGRFGKEAIVYSFTEETVVLKPEVMLWLNDHENPPVLLMKPHLDQVLTALLTNYQGKVIVPGTPDHREKLENLHICTDAFRTAIPFDDCKCNDAGLIPCIVQDVKNDEVLMMAWMNREAFEKTLATGRMTYFSRSRQSLWVKGETSGHFQYLKSLSIDCDNDTLLAKVEQVGAACHTGNRSCFYREIAGDMPAAPSDLQILKEVYNTIKERRLHPKEGSYTNYLFDQGIDKILKKCGEESTEIVIAAKNPDSEELKYEIADYLYHLMVLMNVRDLTWEDITAELANRH